VGGWVGLLKNHGTVELYLPGFYGSKCEHVLFYITLNILLNFNTGVHTVAVHPTLDFLVTGGRDSVGRVRKIKIAVYRGSFLIHTYIIYAFLDFISS
jgi:hypothetical protein